MVIIQGMENGIKKKQIFFEWYKESDFTFKKVQKLIRATFFKVKKTGLFDPKNQLCQLPFSPASLSSSLNKTLQ